MNTLKIFNGSSNLPLAVAIASSLNKDLGKVTIVNDGETRVEIGENVRGMDVFIIQSTCPPVNQNLMELLLMIDAAKRASASRITAVMPYYGYARQDHKAAPRTPIAAKLVADLITTAGADRVLTMDLHADQIQGFFKLPVDNLYASRVMLEELRSFGLGNLTVVAPHTGVGDMAKAYAKRLGTPLVFVDKRMDGSDGDHVFNVIGEVAGRVAIIVSDMIDTAVTITEAAGALAEQGSKLVIVCATHAVMAEPAAERIMNSEINRVVVTDTIPLSGQAKAGGKTQVLSVSRMLAEAILRIHRHESISCLFE